MPAPFITRAPADVAGWAACFDVQTLPVLAQTAESIALLKANEDAVDAHLLAGTVSADPLMTLKLMAHVAALQQRRGHATEAETVTAALVLLGIGPFFRAFGELETVEDALDGRPEALDGFHAVLRRGGRAANFAMSFAVHRMDHDAAVIHQAALLHDLAELLLWLRAPALAAAVAARQAADPALRSAVVQRELLNIELPDLQHGLMLLWCLPSLLVKISDRHADADQVRNVLLAVRAARHSSNGFDNPALPDDVAEIADLLQLGIEPVWRLLRDVDA